MDAQYLKSVLTKFTAAVAGGRAAERDALLPVISAVLGASAAEFRALQLAAAPPDLLSSVWR